MSVQINSGSYGTIYKVEDKASNETFALKVVNHKSGSIQNILEVILYFTLSQYIVRAYSYEVTSSDYKILMPLASYDLNKMFKYKVPKMFDIKKELYNICLGVEYLHSRNIVHGDIKPSNILVFKNEGKYSLKLTDFSVSGFCYKRIYNKNAFTRGFQAPEIETKESYDFKADIWALGQVFKMCQEKFQILGCNDFDDLIKNMTYSSEKSRYDIYQVLNSPFFSAYNTSNKFKEECEKYSTLTRSGLSSKVIGEVNFNDIETDFIEKLIAKMSREKVYEDTEFLRQEIYYTNLLLNFFEKNIF